MSKYSKSTVGYAAQVFVAKATAYTDDADYKAFVANAAEGEMGVFLVYDADATTTYDEANAVVQASDTAMKANDKFFIAQKIDGLVKRTPTYTYSQFTVTTDAYEAPVRQVTNIGYTGTSGSLNSGTLVAGQIFTLGFLETTPANNPFPRWNYEETAKYSDSLVAIGSRIVKQANDTMAAQNQSNGRLVDLELLTNGTFSASSGGSATMVNGSNQFTIAESAGAAADAGKYAADASSIAAGTYLRIGGTTGAYAVYKVAAVANVGTALATITLESPYTGASGAVTAANLGVMTVVTEIGFKATAKDDGAHFRVYVQEDMANADIAYTTPYKEGCGTYAQVANLEKEGQVTSGYRTGNIAFTADWGQPTSFAVSTTTYQYIILDGTNTQKSMAAPNAIDTVNLRIVLALPVGVAPTTNLDGMFV